MVQAPSWKNRKKVAPLYLWNLSMEKNSNMAYCQVLPLGNKIVNDDVIGTLIMKSSFDKYNARFDQYKFYFSAILGPIDTKFSP